MALLVLYLVYVVKKIVNFYHCAVILLCQMTCVIVWFNCLYI